MKTIFISCFRGIISRNILATDAFDMLRDRADIRVVIIAPESRIQVLTKEFGGPNVVVEGVAVLPLRGAEHVMWVIATNLLMTGTRRVQRRAKLARDHNWFDYGASLFVGALGRVKPVRQLFRFFANRIVSSEFISLFERYRPSLVFSTDIYDPYDVKLMRQAHHAGVRIVGMVRSWDNVTSKTLLTFIPEELVVNSERIKAELVRYGDVRPECVTAVGVPHYDRYLNEHNRTPREQFIREVGLDPSQKLILFTPPSDRYLKGDPIAPVILDALSPVKANVLVRFPLVGKSEVENYTPPANVVFDSPANSPDFGDVHLDRAADQHLADSIFASDLVITWASTMIVDAAVFDKPIILVGFDATPRPYGRSIQQYYDYDHQRRIIETGGCRLVKNTDELVRAVEEYLISPGRDHEGRAKIMREYCGELDRYAGKRLGTLLLQRI